MTMGYAGQVGQPYAPCAGDASPMAPCFLSTSPVARAKARRPWKRCQKNRRRLQSLEMLSEAFFGGRLGQGQMAPKINMLITQFIIIMIILLLIIIIVIIMII